MKLHLGDRFENRKFHELAQGVRPAFLERCYAEVCSHEQGEFTPHKPATKLVVGAADAREQAALLGTDQKLNFLMVRTHLERRPEWADRVRHLALLRFEYLFLPGNREFSQNPQTIAAFFLKRGKPELIRPALMRLAERALEYEYLAKQIFKDPIFEKVLGADVTVYRLRARLHGLLDKEDLSKSQAATALLKEGFDLVKLDFNRWYAVETNNELQTGERTYRRSKKNEAWLSHVVAEHNAQRPEGGPTAGLEPATIEAPKRTLRCSVEAMANLDASIRRALAAHPGDPAMVWLQAVLPLTADHQSLKGQRFTKIESQMWEYLWGGDFVNMARQLQGAEAAGRTRNGLTYCHWALGHPEHSATIHPLLAQDAYAMIIAGDILVGDLTAARQLFTDPKLARFKNELKLRAAINLAWEMFQHPGQGDEPKGYEPPRAYLYEVAKTFGGLLVGVPTISPYLNLTSADRSAVLGDEEHRVLASISDLATIERLCTQVGMADKIRDRFVTQFDEALQHDREYMIFSRMCHEALGMIEDPLFRRYVDDATIRQLLKRWLGRLSDTGGGAPAQQQRSGLHELRCAMYLNSTLRPFVEGAIDIQAEVRGLIDETLSRHGALLDEPYSLRNDRGLELYGARPLKLYRIVDTLRAHVDNARMGRFVAYVLAAESDMSADSWIPFVSAMRDLAKHVDQSGARPAFLPDLTLNHVEQRIQVLTKVYQREQQLGTLDRQTASNAVANVLFHATYVKPHGAFYPHLDSVLALLRSPLVELLPQDGVGADALLEYRILKDFLAEGIV